MLSCYTLCGGGAWALLGKGEGEGGLERSREVGSQAVYAECQGLSCWPLTQVFSLWAVKRVALCNLEPTDSWTVLVSIGRRGEERNRVHEPCSVEMVSRLLSLQE